MQGVLAEFQDRAAAGRFQGGHLNQSSSSADVQFVRQLSWLIALELRGCIKQGLSAFHAETRAPRKRNG
jgi:hypothetical protein